ncbi:MAG TPA: M1 family peptidase, partial [Saprospiraceae bacterium]|nr:M1 family peptidase [Saprospiraceae bacterium]
MPRLLLLLVMLGILPVTDYAQFIQTTTEKFTRADTLRGSLRPERNCYDVIHYNIDLELLVADKAITGFVDMRFKVKNDFNRLQIDLFDNMIIDSILLGGQKCTY